MSKSKVPGRRSELKAPSSKQEGRAFERAVRECDRQITRSVMLPILLARRRSLNSKRRQGK